MSNDQKLRRSYTAAFRESAVRIDERDDKVVDLQNHYSVNKSEINCIIYDRGVDVLHAEMLDVGLSDPLKTAIYTTLGTMREDRTIVTNLSTIYERMGPEKFMEWAKTLDETSQQRVQRFLETECFVDVEELRWSKRADLLIDECLADGELHPADEIHQKAMEVGLIDDSEKEWSRLRTTAHRKGVTQTSKYGMWQRQKTPSFVSTK